MKKKLWSERQHWSTESETNHNTWTVCSGVSLSVSVWYWQPSNHLRPLRSCIPYYWKLFSISHMLVVCFHTFPASCLIATCIWVYIYQVACTVHPPPYKKTYPCKVTKEKSPRVFVSTFSLFVSNMFVLASVWYGQFTCPVKTMYLQIRWLWTLKDIQYEQKGLFQPLIILKIYTWILEWCKIDFKKDNLSYKINKPLKNLLD